MNMQEYFEIMDAVSERDLADIVSGSRLRHSPQEQEDIMVRKSHHTGRKMTAAIACAAVLLVGGGLAAGAAANWDSGAVFSHFFMHPSEEPVDYTAYAALGRDVGETLDFGDFQITVDSVMTDGQQVYVVYEYTMPDGEKLFPGQQLERMDLGIQFWVIDPNDRNDRGALGARGILMDEDESGVVHAVNGIWLEEGYSIEGKSLWLRCANVTAFNGDETLDHTYPEQELLIPLDGTGISVLHGDADFEEAYMSGTGHASAVQISALGFRLSFDTLSEGAWAQQEASDFSAYDVGGNQPENRTLTAVYADGTEVTLSGDWSDMTYGNKQEDGSTLMQGEYQLSFNRPLSLDGLTAVRYNGTEITVG